MDGRSRTCNIRQFRYFFWRISILTFEVSVLGILCESPWPNCDACNNVSDVTQGGPEVYSAFCSQGIIRFASMMSFPYGFLLTICIADRRAICHVRKHWYAHHVVYWTNDKYSIIVSGWAFSEHAQALMISSRVSYMWLAFPANSSNGVSYRSMRCLATHSCSLASPG